MHFAGKINDYCLASLAKNVDKLVNGLNGKYGRNILGWNICVHFSRGSGAYIIESGVTIDWNYLIYYLKRMRGQSGCVSVTLA